MPDSSNEVCRGRLIYDGAVYVTIDARLPTQEPETPPMLTFTLYTADDYDRTRRAVHIDPNAVVAVEETERRPAFGGYHSVAIITLATGKEYVVEDGAKRAARQIAEARHQEAPT
jgi:hypothetical protein